MIIYEGNRDAIVWKHPKSSFSAGAQIIVHGNQEALFFRDGKPLDLFGAGKHTLDIYSAPILAKLCGDFERSSHVDLYFINTGVIAGIRWGTDTKVRLFDPATGIHVELGACGTFHLRVTDSRKLLLRLNGAGNGLESSEIFEEENAYFRGVIGAYVKNHLARIIQQKQIPVLAIDAYLLEISNELTVCINENLEQYGLEITEFYITRLITPDEDPDFRRVKQQYAQKHLVTEDAQIELIKARAEAEKRLILADADCKIRNLNNGEKE